MITKHDHPAAVLVSPEDLAEETLDIVSDPEALAGIREAEAAYARGDVTTGDETPHHLGRTITGFGGRGRAMLLMAG